MTEDRVPLSISIPHELDVFLEHESSILKVKKSSIIQEELYNRMRRKKNEGKDKLALSLLLVLIGITLLAFSIFIFPIVFVMFLGLVGIGFLSMFTGYIGMLHVVFKKQKKTTAKG